MRHLLRFWRYVNTATIRGMRAAFASTARNVSRGVGSARYPAMRASARSALRTSLNSGSDRWSVGRKERAASSACRPALSIARMSAGHAGGSRIRVVERSRARLMRARASANGLRKCGGWGSGLRERCKGESRVPCEAVAERDEVLDAEEIYACLRGGHLCLVKPVDAGRRNG